MKVMSNTVIYEYPNYYLLTRFKSGFVPNGTQKKEKNKSIKKTEESESLRCSISRTKRMIKDYILCNDFKYFATWTLKDELDMKAFKKKLSRMIIDYNARNKMNIIYLLVFERGKEKGRLHAHGVISEIPRVYKNDFGYLSSKLFDKLGFNSYSEIRDKEKCSSYIQKYLTKDIMNEFKGQRYLCSQGLKLPLEVDRAYLFNDEYEWDFETEQIQQVKLNKETLKPIKE